MQAAYGEINLLRVARVTLPSSLRMGGGMVKPRKCGLTHLFCRLTCWAHGDCRGSALSLELPQCHHLPSNPRDRTQLVPGQADGQTPTGVLSHIFKALPSRTELLGKVGPEAAKPDT